MNNSKVEADYMRERRNKEVSEPLKIQLPAHITAEYNKAM